MYAFEISFYMTSAKGSLTIETADRFEAIAQAHAFIKANPDCTGFSLLGAI